MLIKPFAPMARPWILFEEPGDGGSPAPDPGDPPGIPAPIQGLIDRNAGDAIQAINQLMAENARLRQERKDLRSKIPGDGAVILAAEQAQQWQAIQEAGITPDHLAELQQAAQERDQLRAERDQLARRQTIQEAAGLAGFRPTVLETLAADLAIQIDGDTEKVPTVMDGENRIPLADYAATHWADFMPALTTTANAGRAGNGTPYPPQGSGRAPQPTSAARQTIAKLYGG